MYRTERKKSIVNHRYESGGCYQTTHQSIDENNKNNRSFNEIKMKSIVSAEKNIPSRFRSSNIFRMAKLIKGKPKNVIVEMGDALVSEAGISTDNLGPCLCILLDFMRGNTPMCSLHHYDSELSNLDVPLPQLLHECLAILCRSLKECLSLLMNRTSVMLF